MSAHLEYVRQIAKDALAVQICHRCHRKAVEEGYARWLRCAYCGKPVCDICAVLTDEHFYCDICPPVKE